MEKIEKVFCPRENISNDYSYLKEYYSKKGVNLMNDPQFTSYQLLSINDNYDLLNYLPPRVYDRKNDSTIYTNGIEDCLFIYLCELFSKYDFNLSLKPSSLFFVNGFEKIGDLLEHLETGQYFNINNFNGILITKLYDEKYDNLWININGLDLTFEEIIQDFDNYEDMIVTQVVHSQYIKKDENLFITHLDHEFIFYTFDEYEKRQSNPYQKGEAQTRIKTFKIDNAMIPITDNENILFNILEMKFQNKELLEEYFNVIKS